MSTAYTDLTVWDDETGEQFQAALRNRTARQQDPTKEQRDE